LTLPTKKVRILGVLGYPYAANQVFYVRGEEDGREGYYFVKVAGYKDSNLANEAAILSTLRFPHIPEIAEKGGNFLITRELKGQRLSTIVGDNAHLQSMAYMAEFGKTLAELHAQQGNFPEAPHRHFHDLPVQEKLDKAGLGFVFEYLEKNQPKSVHRCFVHGDFHYANLLWENGHISGILDFELAGTGNREFDIAWSLILRPDQRFMKTKEELEEFLRGYESVSPCDRALIHYYMVLIYARFVFMGNEEYKGYVCDWLTQNTIR
jgi:aminoglycoside phosphotransferase (APT) family kinase protein